MSSMRSNSSSPRNGRPSPSKKSPPRSPRGSIGADIVPIPEFPPAMPARSEPPPVANSWRSPGRTRSAKNGRIAMTNVFAGVMPALMTPCNPDRTPDFRALTRKGRELIETGMSAVVYCGSMGDWPLLTDEQRMQGVEHLVNAGVPVIVGTGAQNSQRAAALARHAKEVGAKGLMIIPRVLSRGASPAAQRAHFAGVLEAAVDLPSVIYNSPYYGFQTRAELFFELRRSYAHLVGFKEFGGAESLSYAAEHIAGASPTSRYWSASIPKYSMASSIAGQWARSRASATCCPRKPCT